MKPHRTRTPTTHALGHPIKVRATPLHPTSLSHIRPAARCPGPVTCGPILGNSESVSPWNVYLNHCHYQQECLRRSIFTHSLFDTPDSVPRTLPDLWTDHFLDVLSLIFCWSTPHTPSSLLAPTRSHAWIRQTPVLISGLRYGGLVPPPTKADFSILATSPWYKQILADPSSMHHPR